MMSVALERNNSGGDQRIERSGFVSSNMIGGSSIFDSPETDSDKSAASEEEEEEEEEENQRGSISSSSSSSIGKNSDDEEEEEVQSEFTEGALDSLEALEEVLPVKKSISKFYCGKSKSFTSLSDAASCSSVKDITKPENAYTKKRKNLLAFNMFWESNRNSILRSSAGGIAKRPSNSRSMLSLAATANSSESNSGDTSNSNSSSLGCGLPPLPPLGRKSAHIEMLSSPPVDKFPSRRTYSLFDLQGAAAVDASSPNITGLRINNSD